MCSFYVSELKVTNYAKMSVQTLSLPLVEGTREMAYTQAIISAGVVYTVTRACSMGNLSECNCDKKLTGTEKKKHYKGWSWGGCSVDLSFGLDLSSRFVNAREEKHNAFWLMNRHNSRAGRQVGDLIR